MFRIQRFRSISRNVQDLTLILGQSERVINQLIRTIVWEYDDGNLVSRVAETRFADQEFVLFSDTFTYEYDVNNNVIRRLSALTGNFDIERLAFEVEWEYMKTDGWHMVFSDP